VRDKKLIILVALLIVLTLGHDVDHIFRGDIPWPLTSGPLLPKVIIFIQFAFLGLALFFYLKNKIGVLGDRRGHWRAIGPAGPFQSVHRPDSTVHLPRLCNTCRRRAGGGFARRTHAHPDHHRNLREVSVGETNSELVSSFRRRARHLRSGLAKALQALG
jgi:hypothetical protein